jgi:hypothetical protein
MRQQSTKCQWRIEKPLKFTGRFGYGRPFAHVRNCLLVKKMSDVQKSNRGRKKPVTDSLRNRHKKDNSAKYNKTRVCIGDEYDSWTELRTS